MPISPQYTEVLFPDSDDIKNVDLTGVHNLSGPVAVEGAEPGDCLVVDILDGTSTCSKILWNVWTWDIF
jgi:acetamidase/formamidase